MDRFWSKVGQGDGGCFLWQAAKTPKGYGKFRMGDGWKLAHRVAYELVRGSIPDGMTLDHLCRNPSCVNPFHLEPVTLAENTLRGESANAKNARKTHCKHGHEFTKENTIRNRRGHRKCRQCHYDIIKRRRRAVA